MNEAEEAKADPWTRRARPAFLYVMYALLLWSVPMGLVAGIDPALAAAIIAGVSKVASGNVRLAALA